MNLRTMMRMRGQEAGGLADFAAQLSSDPAFAQNWADVEAQLHIEGATASDLNVAKGAFSDAYQHLPDLNPDLHGLDIPGAAKAFVLAAHTVQGATATVQGFVDAGAGRARDEVVLGFMGSMVGTLTTAAIGAGAVTAGVGAAIVVGAGIAVAAIESIIGGAPRGGGCERGRTADFTVGQLCVSGPKVAPAARNWRTFPDPGAMPGSEDAQWYRVLGSSGPSLDWKGAHYGYDLGGVNPASTGYRPIDYAFGTYNVDPSFGGFEIYARGQVASGYTVGIPDFFRTFAAAWRANAEFALNGVQAQTDEEVLVHVLRKWNRAHAGPSVPLTALGDPLFAQIYQATGNIGGDIAINGGPLLQAPPQSPSSGRRIQLGPAIVRSGRVVQLGAVSGVSLPVVAVGGLAAFALLKPKAFAGLLRKVGL